jgi:hypothetical protein
MRAVFTGVPGGLHSPRERQRHRHRLGRLVARAGRSGPHTLRGTEEAHRSSKAAQAQDKLANMAAHSRITDPDELARKKAFIEAAMARARQRTSQ